MQKMRINHNISALNTYNDVHTPFEAQSKILVDFADFMIKEIDNLYKVY